MSEAPRARPRVAARGRPARVALRLSKSLHKRAALLALRDGVSLNQWLLEAIAADVGAHQRADEQMIPVRDAGQEGEG